MTVTSTNQKVQFNGNGSTTVFAYNFKIFAQTDLSVILRSAAGTETVQQLTTNYTVSGVGEASGGNVTMGVAPPSGTTLTILRVQPNLQGLDLVPNDPFPAGSMEDALDKLTFMVQTHDEEIGRSIKASRTNVISGSEFTVSATDRANKLFSFDSSGNLSIAQELGTYRGNWGASTAYAVRDLVKDTSTGNIFICVTAHTSSGSQPLTTNTDAAKWALIVDAASATTSQNAAAASATAAANSATASASSASSSSTKADEAAASASTASTKAGEAANSATASASSATSAASTLTTFQQQYHGAASSNPTSNLTEGDLYFKTGSGGGLRVYNGSAWVNAAFDVSGALINTNNLSDVSNAATALTNLGVTSTAAELNTLDAVPRGSIIYGNSSAATARLSKGATGTVLTAGANDISWATVSSGPDQIVNSTFANPDSTFTSSGTYSKPASVADDDYMWVFIVNGGGGGGNDNYAGYNAYGGTGGNPLLLYGKASNFHNSTYVIGAGGASTTGESVPTVGGTSSITLHASQGGAPYTPSASNFVHYVGGGAVTIGGTTLLGSFTGGNQFTLDTVHSGWATNNTAGAYVNQGGSGGYTTVPYNSVFGGGGGGGANAGNVATVAKFGDSFLSGSGGAGTTSGAGSAGALHGGGGGSGGTSSGAGGSGSMRVYYV